MLRAIGYLFLAVAAVILATDVVTGTGSGELRLSALGAWWAWIDRDSLLLLQPAIERHISPALWDPGIQTLLEWPAGLEFAVLGVLCLLVRRWRGARRRGGGKARR